MPLFVSPPPSTTIDNARGRTSFSFELILKTQRIPDSRSIDRATSKARPSCGALVACAGCVDAIERRGASLVALLGVQRGARLVQGVHGVHHALGGQRKLMPALNDHIHKHKRTHKAPDADDLYGHNDSQASTNGSALVIEPSVVLTR